MAETIRCFVAITLPEAHLKALTELQHELRRQLPEVRIKWVKEENLHLTLRFLGNVAEPSIPALDRELRRVCGLHQDLRLSISGLGCFPNPRRPRVLWAGIAGETEPLKLLQSDVERGVGPFGEHKENKPYNPHLTLGRFDPPPPDPEPIRRCLDLMRVEMQEWQVSEVVLMRSVLKRTGAEYETLSHATLSTTR